MNKSCQNEVDLVFHPAFQVFVMTSVVFSFAAFIFMAIIFKKYAFRVYWHSNIKMLFFFNMVISFFLATSVVVNFVGLWYRMLFKSQSCQVVLQLEHCTLIRFVFLVSFCLIPLNHAAIVLERLWATIRLSKYEKSSGTLGIVLVCVIIVISFVVVYLIMLPEDFEEYVPSCLSFSATKIGNNIYYLFSSQFFTEFLILSAHNLLLRYNRKQRLKHANENLSEKFQVNENLSVLEQMNPLIITCSLVIGGYNIVAIAIRPFRSYFTKNQYIIIVFSIFIIPYLPFLLTFTAYHMLRKQLQEREETTKNAVEIDIVRNAHFSNDYYNWDSYYVAKYGAPRNTEPQTHWWKKLFKNKVKVLTSETN